MIIYNSDTKAVSVTTGGYSDAGVPITDTFVSLGSNPFFSMRCILYRPEREADRKKVGLVVVHSDDDYSRFPVGAELAKRGYTALCGQVISAFSPMDRKIENIAMCVDFLRSVSGIEKIVLLGHSGGASLMSAYQAAAENGPAIFSPDRFLVKMNIHTDLVPADGLMLLDSNWGNGSMTLFSIDPAVREEGNGVDLDPEYDIFDPANGFRKGDSCYTEAFKTKYFAAQRERNNRLVKKALDRLALLEQGKGNFRDDEPFIVAGGAQFKPCNKMIPEDVHLAAHTKEAHMLYHAGGRVTEEIVHCVRKADGFDSSLTPIIGSCLVVTLRDFLTNRAVLANEDYGIYEDEVRGVCWENTWNCTPGNVRFVSAPLLIMGMTGSYEYLASEIVYKNAGSSDKTLGFVEGASHNFFVEPNTLDPESYGDTAMTAFNRAAQWLDEKFSEREGY